MLYLTDLNFFYFCIFNSYVVYCLLEFKCIVNITAFNESFGALHGCNNRGYCNVIIKSLATSLHILWYYLLFVPWLYNQCEFISRIYPLTLISGCYTLTMIQESSFLFFFKIACSWLSNVFSHGLPLIVDL